MFVLKKLFGEIYLNGSSTESNKRQKSSIKGERIVRHQRTALSESCSQCAGNIVVATGIGNRETPFGSVVKSTASELLALASTLIYNSRNNLYKNEKTYALLNNIPKLLVAITVVPQVVHFIGQLDQHFVHLDEHECTQNHLYEKQDHQECRILME